ncbi:MAG: plasmid-related transcriptional repressor protein, partial [Gammaproteobacteria bacterium]|nr:plasmid-related transcriptional repressor protein [Gammaproteobacteria bacterium]
MFLPGFDIGALPNHLNRSSLFAPIKRGPREFHRQAVMVTRKDCDLQYTGEQLDEADGDLIMALIAFAQRRPIGVAVPLNRAELLCRIERGTGKQQYEWLHRRLKAMTEATLFIKAKKPDGTTRYSIGIGKTEPFRIVAGIRYDDESEVYSYRLDPRWVQMFGNLEYSLIDWEKRMQIGRGQDMAKSLQRLVATSADQVQRYALDWL